MRSDLKRRNVDKPLNPAGRQEPRRPPPGSRHRRSHGRANGSARRSWPAARGLRRDVSGSSGPFVFGEPASRVDWRRSAREGRAFVREREWEAAHTVWIWFDRSASMRSGRASPPSRRSSAPPCLRLPSPTCACAAANVRVSSGSPGRSSSQGVVERFAEAIAADERLHGVSEDGIAAACSSRGAVDGPADQRFSKRSCRNRADDPRDQRARGDRRTGDDRRSDRGDLSLHRPYRISSSCRRAESRRLAPRIYATPYLRRLAEHRARLREACALIGWGMAVHRTDASPAEILLALRGRLSAPGSGRHVAERLTDAGTPASPSSPPPFSSPSSGSGCFTTSCGSARRRRAASSFRRCRLLLGLDPKEAEPARSPWPITVLRLLIGALIILAMAQPLWNSLAGRPGGGPLLVLVDDGWAAAPNVPDADRLCAPADRSGGAFRARRRAPAAIAGRTGHRAARSGRGRRTAARARPQPYAPPRKDALAAIQRFLQRQPATEILWIADGVELGDAKGFAEGLADAHPRRVRRHRRQRRARARGRRKSRQGSLDVRLTRSATKAPAGGAVRALDAQGREVGRADFDFGSGLAATARFELPVELRNQVDPCRDRRRSLGRRDLARGRTLPPQARRDRVGRQRRRRPAAAGAELLPSPRLAALRGHRRMRTTPPRIPILALLAEKPSVLVLADMSVRAWTRT